MSNNLQKAFLITTALYVFVGGSIFVAMVGFAQSSSSKNYRQVCLACFKEANLQPKQESKPETKKAEKLAKKEPQAKQPIKESMKAEQKPQAQHTPNNTPQLQQAQESVNPQKQFNDLNGNKIKEILAKHANNSHAQKARNNKITGTCKISFVLHPDGTVSNKDISDCHMLLQNSAKIAIEDAAPELPKPHDNCKITTSIDYTIIRG
jgi:outer membrane biosynthesis protein TonB